MAAILYPDAIGLDGDNDKQDKAIEMATRIFIKVSEARSGSVSSSEFANKMARFTRDELSAGCDKQRR